MGSLSHVPPSDADLVTRVRGGDDSAYQDLYRRHADSVRRYARGCCRDGYTAEDLTGEVFARTLQAIRGGSGPDSAVRAYLLTTVRRVAAVWGATAKREHLVEDFAAFAVSAAGSSTNEASGSGSGLDPGPDVLAMREAEQSPAYQAFLTLPERWRTVLWHTAVEEESPSEIAPLFGLTANATAVLAHRAREGLRQAYLRAHVSSTPTAEASCTRYADRLGAHVREGLRTRADRELRKHLARCARCRLAAAELADVNAALKGLLPVAVIGWFATAYVAKAAGLAAGGAAVAGAGAAAGAAGAAAGAAGGSSAGGTAWGGAAAAEGLGAPVKTAIAAGVVVAAAGVALAVVLTGGGGKAPVQAAKKPSAAPVVPARPSPRPKPSPSSAPPSPTAPAAGSRPAPVMFRTPEPTPKPTPSPKPTLTPTPTPSPTPTPTPAPQIYPVSQFGHTGIGNGTTPTIRATVSNWVWQRRGLSAGGRSYSHGLTVSTPSSVLIDLNRACTSYDALAGIDDLALGLGAARFSVYGDGARLWQSGVLHGGDPAVPVHVAVSGRETIRLVVEATNPSQPVNVADWAMPRITCGQ